MAAAATAAALWAWLALLPAPAAAAPTAAAAAASSAATLASPPLASLPPPPCLSLDAAAPEGAGERLLRDGLVLLRSKSTFHEAKRLVDDLMEGMHLKRNPMSTETRNGTSLNPTNDSSLVSPLRVAYIDNHVLAPADDTAQGPHQEGMTVTRNNRKVIAFYCEEPSEQGGETALFDMQRAWQLLPPDLKERLRRSDFGLPYASNASKHFEAPAVVRHETSGAPCLQFYCFGRLTRDCVDMYRAKTGRYHVRPDPYGYLLSHDGDVLLISEEGQRTPFIGLDLYRTLSSIYDAMYAHRWRKGDILIVDNVRFAHARLEGLGRNRSIRFLTYGPADKSFSLRKLGRP